MNKAKLQLFSKNAARKCRSSFPFPMEKGKLERHFLYILFSKVIECPIPFAAIDLKSLAFLVHNTLKEHGIEAILVGGACVSIYSENRYQSYDLDFVTFEDLKKLEKPLEALGFKRVGRCFTHKNCPYLLDFVNPPIAIGNESIRTFETLISSSGILKLLTPTDCVKDRLAAYFYWGDPQSLEQAYLVAKHHPIDSNNLTIWSQNEGFLEKLQLFLDSLK